MRAAPLWTVLAAVFVPAIASAGPSVVDAKKAVETARANLAKAVQKIEKDPPANADLDAALAAVEALKVAVDAGAEHEPKDLEYAKIALAARKELRTQREYVETRRANIMVFEHRRQIEKSVEALNDAVSKFTGRDATAELMKTANNAAAEVEKLVEGGKQFISRDAKFASYLQEVTSTIDRQRKAIQERWDRALVDKQKATVDASRRALADALAAISGMEPTDAQFDAADKAATELAKLLDASKELEARNKDYRAHAAELRKDIDEARKRIDAAWSQNGLTRMKAEIEPPRADLIQAGKALRARNASQEQISEARTAAIVVRKVMEKFQRLASKSPAFAQYLNEVKKSLLEVEVDLQKRSVELARDAANAAMDKTSAKGAGEETFANAEAAVKSALAVLEQGEAIAKDDRTYATWALDARKRLRDLQDRVVTKRAEADLAKQRAQLDEAKNELTRALRPLERRAPTDEQFAEANTAAIVLQKTLEGAKPKDPGLARYVADLRTFLASSKQTMEKRRLEVDLERQKSKVEAGRSEIAGLVKRIWGSRVPNERLVDVEQAVDRVRKILTEGAELAKKDRNYQTYHREVEKRMEEMTATIATRREELAVEAQQLLVDPELRSLNAALVAIDGLGPKQQAIAGAEKAAADTETALAQGTELEKRNRVYAAWSKNARSTLDSAKKKIAKKKLEVAASDSKSAFEERLAAAKSTLALAKQAQANDGDVGAATESFQAAKAAVEGGAALEKEDARYAAQAARARETLDKLAVELELATKARAFRKSTAERLNVGIGEAESANAMGEKNLRQQKEKYEKAIEGFKACRSDGERMLDEVEGLETTSAMVDGQLTKPKQVIALCSSKIEATEDALRKVMGLLNFEDGPKKSYEKGKSLLGSNKQQALAEFENCISSVKILQFKNPELKERKFEVGGASVTLAELLGQCTAETKKIRAK